MPDRTARELLKKKALDRWENEGGSVFAGATRVDEYYPTAAHGAEANQLPVPRVITEGGYQRRATDLTTTNR